MRRGGDQNWEIMIGGMIGQNLVPNSEGDQALLTKSDQQGRHKKWKDPESSADQPMRWSPKGILTNIMSGGALVHIGVLLLLFHRPN